MPALVVGLLVAFAYATYLSYWGSQRVESADGYVRAVLAAERDNALVQDKLFEMKMPIDELGPDIALVRRDLETLDANARTPAERAPDFFISESRNDYTRLENELAARQALGEAAFAETVKRNELTRDLSNALFALIALLFAILIGWSFRAIDEGRSLVARLQRVFTTRRRVIPNVDVGSVLISATRGSNVGGDTHDAFTFDGRHGLFLVADVSGKGIEAAVDTALIKYSVRTLFHDDVDPGVVLTKFAQIYARSAEKSDAFVVLFLASLDLEDGTMRYASAGHEPAWVVRGGRVDALPPTGAIVGIDDEEVYGTRTLQLRAGDALVVTTDGLTESRDARGQFLGAEGVQVWLTDLAGTAQARADAVVRRLWRRSRGITDDLAILVVRYQPARAPLPPAPPTTPALSAAEAAN
jgi:serine phosphatase RsbU (regulator of sigma subunit)